MWASPVERVQSIGIWEPIICCRGTHSPPAAPTPMKRRPRASPDRGRFRSANSPQKKPEAMSAVHQHPNPHVPVTCPFASHLARLCRTVASSGSLLQNRFRFLTYQVQNLALYPVRCLSTSCRAVNHLLPSLTSAHVQCYPLPASLLALVQCCHHPPSRSPASALMPTLPLLPPQHLCSAFTTTLPPVLPPQHLCSAFTTLPPVLPPQHLRLPRSPTSALVQCFHHPPSRSPTSPPSLPLPAQHLCSAVPSPLARPAPALVQCCRHPLTPFSTFAVLSIPH